MKQDLLTYIYYSDDKIRELAQQLPPLPWWRRFLDRLRKVDIKVLGTGPAIDIAPPPDPEHLQTLKNVWRHLDAKGRVGTFDDPKQYFHGRLEFYYGIFDTVNPPVFFLVGGTDRTIVALGGSKKHVRGHRDHKIEAEENSKNVTMEPDVATLIYTGSETVSPAAATVEAGDLWAIHVVGMYKNWQFWQGKKMEFEVLAHKEKLVRQVGPPFLESARDVLIGSPIFVAQE